MSTNDTNNYVALALSTEATNQYDSVTQRLNEQKGIRFLHASLGLLTEAGELADIIKKQLFYGKPIDLPNLIEELGDIEWYLAIFKSELALQLNSTPAEIESRIRSININKLQLRYPDKFTESDAVNRNLEAEQALLSSAVADLTEEGALNQESNHA